MKLYDVYLEKWTKLCVENRIYPHKPTLIEVVKLCTHFQQGASYSAINTLSLTDDPRPVTKDTIIIARWLRITMQMASINTEVFKAHSIRGASTSKCHSLHVPVETILKRARWTNATTFAKYYKKTVSLEKEFQSTMLSNAVTK